MVQLPHEMEFVVDVPIGDVRERHEGFDVYRVGDGVLPVVVIVPGPAPAAYPFRPRSWPVYEGYARLLAERGVVGVVAHQPYHSVEDVVEQSEVLAGIVEDVRALDGVDAGRVAVWGFSGGALLMGRWLSQAPEWLRCLGFSYPLLGDGRASSGVPVVLTRVGLELPERQKTVDAFLAEADGVEVVEVPDGQHAFDVLDHTEQSRNAVVEAVELVVGHVKA